MLALAATLEMVRPVDSRTERKLAILSELAQSPLRTLACPGRLVKEASAPIIDGRHLRPSSMGLGCGLSPQRRTPAMVAADVGLLIAFGSESSHLCDLSGRAGYLLSEHARRQPTRDVGLLE